MDTFHQLRLDLAACSKIRILWFNEIGVDFSQQRILKICFTELSRAFFMSLMSQILSFFSLSHLESMVFILILVMSWSQDACSKSTLSLNENKSKEGRGEWLHPYLEGKNS